MVPSSGGFTRDARLLVCVAAAARDKVLIPPRLLRDSLGVCFVPQFPHAGVKE